MTFPFPPSVYDEVHHRDDRVFLFPRRPFGDSSYSIRVKFDGGVVEFDGTVPEFLPASVAPLAGKVLRAKPSTIFAMGTEGGYAVPPREFTLVFGRARDDVHVPVGPNDPYVRRVHGKFVCDGRDWWLHNEGYLPIQARDALLLQGNRLILARGYTPLLIRSGQGRSHLLEAHVVDVPAPVQDAAPEDKTEFPEGYELSPAERTVLAALAQRYLRGDEKKPQPVSWQQVADDMNRTVPGQAWTRKKAEHIVARVRERLADDPRAPVPGLRREEGIGEPVGNTLNHNLIQALLLRGTLRPDDLRLLNDSE